MSHRCSKQDLSPNIFIWLLEPFSLVLAESNQVFAPVTQVCVVRGNYTGLIENYFFVVDNTNGDHIYLSNSKWSQPYVKVQKTSLIVWIDFKPEI